MAVSTRLPTACSSSVRSARSHVVRLLHGVTHVGGSLGVEISTPLEAAQVPLQRAERHGDVMGRVSDELAEGLLTRLHLEQVRTDGGRRPVEGMRQLGDFVGGARGGHGRRVSR